MRFVELSRAMRPDRWLVSRCGFCLGLYSVNHNRLFLTLNGSGMDRAQIDTFCCELLQVLRQRPGLVRQFVLLCPSLLVYELGFVEDLLCSLGVFDHKVDCTGCPLGRS